MRSIHLCRHLTQRPVQPRRATATFKQSVAPSTSPAPLSMKRMCMTAAATPLAPSQQLPSTFVVPHNGRLDNLTSLPSFVDLKNLLFQACLLATEFINAHPHIENAEKLCRKLKADLGFAEKLLLASATEPTATSDPLPQTPESKSSSVAPESGTEHTGIDTEPCAGVSTGETPPSGPCIATDSKMHAVVNTGTHTTGHTATNRGGDRDTGRDTGRDASVENSTPRPHAPPASLIQSIPHRQGILNNLHGFMGEYLAASHAPGVVAVSKKVQSVSQVDVALAVKRGLKATSMKGRNIKAEVDVVAQGGHAWIEVKNHESFGLDSAHWVGQKGHARGLKVQVEELLQVAKAPCNARRWQPPRLVLFFPGAASQEVLQELEGMGVHTAVGIDALRSLPPPPPPPSVTNLDVTTLCALVSQVSYCDPHDPAMLEWSKGFEHWGECLMAEREQPLMETLAPYLEGRRLICSATAVAQLEELLRMWSGPKERQRWAEWKEKLEIMPAGEEGGDPELCTERVLALASFGAQWKAVFGLGDAQHAVTLTANGNAVRAAQQQGVFLEIHHHHPVWLTGM